MMFVQFFIWGAWAVTLGTYLGTTLQFEGTQIGLIYGTTAIAAIVSPLFVGFVADRYFASQKVFSVLHLAGAVFLYLASQASGFGEIYALLLVYSLCYMPTLAIANGIGFRHLKDPDRQFPLIRVLGTIGWIVAGLVVGFLGVEDRNIPLQIAAGMSVLLAVYGFALPDTPPKPSSEPQTVAHMLGLDAFSLLRNRSFLVLFIASVLISIPLAFYYNFTNLFLNELGMENAAGKQTLGQQSEVLFMLLMPFLVRRMGIKWMVRRHVCLDHPLRAVRLWRRQPGNGLDAVRGHRAAWHLLRLLLRGRPDLCQPGGTGVPEEFGAGHDDTGNLWGRHVHRQSGLWLDRQQLYTC
jgi:nucleoside transporter